jgi:hypothetical protein
MDRLPDELLAIVLGFVPAAERIPLRAVSQRWLSVIDATPHFWHEAAAPRLIAGELRFSSITGELRRRCGAGSLAKVQWFVSVFGISAVGSGADALCSAAMGGYLDIAQWLVATLKIAGVGEDTVVRTCAGGHLEVARWLIATFGITAERAEHSLCEAAVGGHLPCVEWLADRFVYSPGVIFSALHEASRGGRLATVQWLVARAEAEAPAPTISRGLRDALCTACGCGHLEVAQLLADRLTRAAGQLLRAAGLEPLRAACAGGSLEVARWFTDTLGTDTIAAAITAEDRYGARVSKTILGRACTEGHLNIAQWLTSTFRLTKADVPPESWRRCAPRATSASRSGSPRHSTSTRPTPAPTQTAPCSTPASAAGLMSRDGLSRALA